MAVHRLERTESQNIHFDWDSDRQAVLRIESGDEVIVETRSGEDGQLSPGSTAGDLQRVDWSRLHALTGPIAVKGAEGGDVLQVELLSLRPDPWGFVMHRPGAGLLAFDEPFLQSCPIDGGAGTVRFGPGIDLPLRPMLGVMGVAPSGSPVSTRCPGPHGGNMDCRALTQGATLFLPVFTPEGLFSCGDGHALQGDGEVCVTGLETGMAAHLRFTVRQGLGWQTPRVEDAATVMTLGAAERYEDAATEALREMVESLSELCDLQRSQAYALASLVVDIKVNQLVNRPVLGARAVLNKADLGLEGDIWRAREGADGPPLHD